MKTIHACLLGNWVNLSADPDCKMGPYRTAPSVWWEESASIWSPITKSEKDTMYQQDYVEIHYLGKDYRIHPMFIQIVSA